MIVLTESTRGLLNNRITKALFDEVINDYEVIKRDIEKKIEGELDKTGKVALLKEEYQKCIDELRTLPNWTANRMDEQMIDFENEPKINTEYLNSVSSESIQGYLLNSENQSEQTFSEHSQRLDFLFEKNVLYYKMYNLALDVVRNKENVPTKTDKKVNPNVTLWNEIMQEQEAQAKKWDKIFYTDINRPERDKILFFNYEDFQDGLEEIQLEIEESSPEIFNPNTDNDLWFEFIGDLEEISSELQHKEIDLLGQYFYPLIQDKRRGICLMCIRDFLNYWTGLINKGIEVGPISISKDPGQETKGPSLEKFTHRPKVNKSIEPSFRINIKNHKKNTGDNTAKLKHAIEDNLKDIMKILINHKYIDNATKPRQFLQIFSGEEVKEKVKWVGSPTFLHHFIKDLYEQKMEPVHGRHFWKVGSQCFDIGVDERRFSIRIKKADGALSMAHESNLKDCLKHLQDINSNIFPTL